MYSNYQQMRLVCPDANNICKTDDIPNPLNIPVSIYVSWLHVDQYVICNVDYSIPTKPLYNCDIGSVHFNHLYCMGMCDKLTRHLSMLIYIYLNVDEC